MKTISILGSTGSIGRQSLNVVASLPERLRVVALAAGTNLDELIGQIARHHPKVVSVGDADRAKDLACAATGCGVTQFRKFNGERQGCKSVATFP